MFVLNDGGRDPTLLADQQHLFDSKLDICNNKHKSDMWKRFKKSFLFFLKKDVLDLCCANVKFS